jgi:hypothetical protein
VAARADAVPAAGDGTVGGAIAAMLWIRLEIIVCKALPLAATLNDLVVVYRRGIEIADVIAYAAVVWIIQCLGAGEDSVGGAADVGGGTLKLRAAASAILYQKNTFSLTTCVDGITNNATTSAVVVVEL